MKTSCSSALLNAAGARDIPAMLDLASEAGFDGIMLECRAGGGFDAAGFSFRGSGEVVRHAVAREIEIQCIASECLRSCDAEHDGEKLRRDVCIAHALACPLVAFSAPPLQNKEHTEAEYVATIEIVRDALDCAQDLDICLGIEPAAHTTVKNIDQALDFIDDVDQPGLGVVYPPGYLAHAHGEPPGKAVEMAQDFMLMTRLEGIGVNDLESGVFDEALAALQRSSFTEYLCDGGAPGVMAMTMRLADLRGRARLLHSWNTDAVDERE
jgi:sugar phosphate isomerase/epimerase